VEVPQKLKLELHYDRAIPVLGLKRAEGYHRDGCIPVFIMALFVIAKLWIILHFNQYMNKEMWYNNYTLEYYLAIKKNEIMPFVGKMDRTGDHHIKWNKPDLDKYCIFFSYVCRI
jgi:hypothetical protein